MNKLAKAICYFNYCRQVQPVAPSVPHAVEGAVSESKLPGCSFFPACSFINLRSLGREAHSVQSAHDKHQETMEIRVDVLVNWFELVFPIPVAAIILGPANIATLSI